MLPPFEDQTNLHTVPRRADLRNPNLGVFGPSLIFVNTFFPLVSPSDISGIIKNCRADSMTTNTKAQNKRTIPGADCETSNVTGQCGKPDEKANRTGRRTGGGRTGGGRIGEDELVAIGTGRGRGRGGLGSGPVVGGSEMKST